MKEEEDRIVQLIKDSPEDGIRQAINIYAPAVKTICRNILRDYGDGAIEEAIQDTFIKLWKTISEGKTITDTLRGYLYSIARNASFDVIRSSRQQNISMDNTYETVNYFDLPELISADMEDEYTQKQNEKLIHEVVEEMSEPDRTIFILRFFYFYKINEIAQKLSLKEDNVESKLRRGRKRLKDKLLERGVIYE